MDEDAWTKLWDKNWEILLAVLHKEDFPAAPQFAARDGQR